MGHVGVLFHRFNNVLETRVSAIRIEALSALVAVVMSFLVIFGSWRRWCTHWFIQKGVMAAYLLSFMLVTYTIGLMQSATVKVEVYPIWAACFLTVFGCTNSISAYSLDENYHIWPQVFQCILYTIYVLLILFSVADGITFIVVFPMVIIALAKVYIRTGSFFRATSLWLYSRQATDLISSEAEDKLPEEFLEEFFTESSMAQEPEESMKRCPYVVRIRTKSRTYSGAPVLKFEAPNYAVKHAPEDFEVITIGKVWRECSEDKWPPLLQPSLHALKDITLSYSLCQLLVFRFFGYSIIGHGEAAKSKGRDFVFKNLLGRRSDEDYERVFQVVEAELAFLYDFFFTKYSSLNSRGTVVWGLASVVSLLCVMALTVARAAGGALPSPSQASAAVVVKATGSDNIVTVTILAALASLELLQMVFYWTSDWGRVAFVCQYIRRHQHRPSSCCWMRLKAFLGGVKLFSSPRYYWRQQLGQVCLFQFQTTIRPNACLSRFALTVNKCCGILEAVGLPRVFLIPQAVLAVWHVKVPSDVRQSVLSSLERTDGHLTNGTSSLVSNRASGLLWACMQPAIRTSAQDKGSQTRVILTWHIATYYCKMQLVWHNGGDGDNEEPHVQVAMTLSQYCAYLIINVPQLLPGHEYDTLCLSSAVAREVATFLEGKDKEEEDRYEAMRRMETDQQTIFGSGIKLGKQLVEEIADVNRRWKVLADFWSEMLLYVAPSYNTRGHIEQLAQGGEFITHLWALLYHAGIVDREDHHHQVAVPADCV